MSLCFLEVLAGMLLSFSLSGTWENDALIAGNQDNATRSLQHAAIKIYQENPEISTSHPLVFTRNPWGLAFPPQSIAFAGCRTDLHTGDGYALRTLGTGWLFLPNPPKPPNPPPPKPSFHRAFWKPPKAAFLHFTSA